MTARRQSGSRDERGQSVAEFAMAVSVFLLLVLGVLDVGRVVWANDALTHASREAARYAIVRGGSSSSRCPVGPPAASALIPAPSSSCPHPSPSKQGIRDVVLSHAVAGGANITVAVCYGEGCSGDTDAAGATNARGTPITVRVTSNVQLVAGSFLGLGNFNVGAQTTMVINH